MEFNDLLCFPAKEESINIPIKIGMKYYMFGMLNGQRWKRSQGNRNSKILDLIDTSGVKAKENHANWDTEILKYLGLIGLVKLRMHLISISIHLEMQIRIRIIKHKTTAKKYM